MSVVLAFMPFGALHHPSLAMGLLTSALGREGIGVEGIYANLLFAEQLGVDEFYQAAESIRSEMLLGEWIFSKSVFGKHDEGFLDWLAQRYNKPHQAAFFEAARRAQALSEGFLDTLAAQIVERRPRVVGASSSFQQNCASLGLLKRVKALDPAITTIMGGANCEGAMGLALVRNFAWLDYAVSGEADQLFPRFCQDVLEGRRPRPQEGLMGRATLLMAGQEAPRATITAMDSLPIPNYHDYFDALEQVECGRRIDPGLVMESSRGCWWGAKHHCTFCGLNGGGMGYRIKSHQRVLEEFEVLHQTYGVNRFEIADNILDMGHLRTVLPELAARGGPYNIFYETKSNLKRSQVQLLAEAGVRWVQPGIESLHDKVLDLMDKGSTALMNVQLLRNAREVGMRLSWNFLSGFPGEDPAWSQEMADWLPQIAHLQPPSGNSRVRYDRFSPYHRHPERYGIQYQPCAAYARVYPLPEQELRELAYFFDDQDSSLRQLEEPGFQQLNQRVKEWRERWDLLPPVLTCEAGQIFDSRFGKPRIYALSQAELEFLKNCESPRAISGSDPVLESLQEKGLLLTLGGKVLDLTVSGEVPVLPGIPDFPGGHVHAKPWTRRYRGRPQGVST